MGVGSLMFLDFSRYRMIAEGTFISVMIEIVKRDEAGVPEKFSRGGAGSSPWTRMWYFSLMAFARF